MSAEWLLDDDATIIPSALVLSHVEQLDRLVSACPEAAPVAVLAGDPCFDRMLASLPLRGLYRRALGADGRTLVVLSSTWGPDSLYGSDPELIPRLAARLPVDRFQLVLVLHPNVTAWHSHWQVTMWLQNCRRAGVVVLDPAEGWRAAVVAADLVIGDHGSVTFYAAALGRPIALAATPLDAVDPRSAVGKLLTTAPRFIPGRDPAATIAEHIRRGLQPELAQVAALVSSDPGHSARLLRAALYRLIALPEPPHPAETPAVPVPTPETVRGRSHVVTVSLNDHGPILEATIERFPASLILSAMDKAPGGAHLTVGTGEPYQRWLQLAEIIVLDDGVDPATPVASATLAQEAATSLAALPGCLLAVARDRDGWLIIGVGPGTRVVDLSEDGPHPETGALSASVLQHWLTLGHEPAALPGRIRLRLGDAVRIVEISQLAG